MTIRLDYTNMMAPPIDGGITDAEWRDVGDALHAPRTPAVADAACGAARSASSTCPTIARCTSRRSTTCGARRSRRGATAHRRRGARHRRLGARAHRAAHRAAARRSGTCSTTRRAAASRGSTCSTTSIRRTSPRCSRGSTCARSLFVVISKSGGTAETMAQYLVVRARLNEVLGDERRTERLVLRHRSAEGRAPHDRANAEGSPRSTFRRTSAVASACSRRSACCPRR